MDTPLMCPHPPRGSLVPSGSCQHSDGIIPVEAELNNVWVETATKDDPEVDLRWLLRHPCSFVRTQKSLVGGGLSCWR